MIIKFWELIVFATETVVHRCSSKWPKICNSIKKRLQLFYRRPLVTISVAKTDQKKQKDIQRKYIIQVFLLKDDAKKQNYKI